MIFDLSKDTAGSERFLAGSENSFWRETKVVVDHPHKISKTGDDAHDADAGRRRRRHHR